MTVLIRTHYSLPTPRTTHKKEISLGETYVQHRGLLRVQRAQRFRRRIAKRLPESCGAIIGAGCEHLTTHAEVQRVNCIRVPLKRLDFLARRQVPDVDQPVCASRRDSSSIRRDGYS